MTSTGPARCPVTIGRAAPLAAIDELVRDAGRGRGRVLALVGEPGVGKSRLVGEARARAAEAGLAVAPGRGSPSARAPFRPFAEALLAVTRTAGVPDDPRLLPYRAALARVVPQWAASASPVEPSPVVFAEAIVRTLAAIASNRGLIVVVEDLHWADPETLAAVEYVADNVADTNAGMLLTTRPDPAAMVLIERLRARAALVAIGLAPLSDARAVDLVRACLAESSAELDDARMKSVVAAAAGLPLLLEDLTAHAISGDRLVPARLRDLVRERLAQVDPSARLVLETAALLGDDVDPVVTGRACGIPVDRVNAVLDSGVAHQLLVRDQRGFAFRHTLTRDAVTALIDPARARDLAGRAASELEDVRGDAETTATLYELAARHEDAARILADAGARALHRDALGSAAVLLGRAIATAPAGASAHRAQRMLVTARVRAGNAVAALDSGRDLLNTRALAGEADEVRRLHLDLARAAVDVERPDEAKAHLAFARTGADANGRARCAELEARLALATIGPDRLIAAEHLAHAAIAAAEFAGDAEVLCDALEVLGRAQRVRDLTVASTTFRRALTTAQAHGLEMQRIRALTELGTIDMFVDVDPARLFAARAAAEQAGAPSSIGGIDVNLAAVLVMGGDLDRALQHARNAEQLGRKFHLRAVAAAGLVFQAVVATHDARYRDVPSLVADAEALAGTDPDILVGTWSMCRAMSSLLQERRPRAGTEFARAAAALNEKPVLAVDPLSGPWLLVRALDGDCSDGEVHVYLQASARGARWSQLWGGLAAAVVAGHSGDPERAAAQAQAAIEAGYPMPLFTALGARLAAEAAVRDGWGDPATWLADALSEFEGRGHVQAAGACRELLRRLGVRTPRPRAVDATVRADLRRRGVTAREAQVLMLLAQHLSNSDIAARLYLSVRTVEKHVAALMRKTGLDSRAELAVAATESSYLP